MDQLDSTRSLKRTSRKPLIMSFRSTLRPRASLIRTCVISQLMSITSGFSMVKVNASSRMFCPRSSIGCPPWEEKRGIRCPGSVSMLTEVRSQSSKSTCKVWSKNMSLGKLRINWADKANRRLRWQVIWYHRLTKRGRSSSSSWVMLRRKTKIKRTRKKKRSKSRKGIKSQVVKSASKSSSER